MKYCKICLNTDTRPNSYFSENGICPACNYYFSLKDVDWEERFDLFKKLIKDHKKRTIIIMIVLLELVAGKIVQDKLYVPETILE